MAQRSFTVPMSPEPQQFSLVLSGRRMTLVSRWNALLPAWCIDLYDADTRAVIVLCLPLVTGVNLLHQHRYLGLPGALICTTDGDFEAPPTETNLGAAGNLYFVVQQ